MTTYSTEPGLRQTFRTFNANSKEPSTYRFRIGEMLCGWLLLCYYLISRSNLFLTD